MFASGVLAQSIFVFFGITKKTFKVSFFTLISSSVYPFASTKFEKSSPDDTSITSSDVGGARDGSGKSLSKKIENDVADDVKKLIKTQDNLEQWETILKQDFPISNQLLIDEIFPALVMLGYDLSTISYSM